MTRVIARLRWTDKYYSFLVYGLLIAGAFLRINRFLFGRSLWLDEAFLALNIIERTPGELLGQLEYGQVAPIGFLIPVKMLAMALGPRESVLRLIQVLAGIASLILFLRLAREWFGGWPLAVAVGLYAFSDTLGEYAAQFKQYSSDAAITLVLLITAVWFWRHAVSRWRYLVLGAVGSLAVWGSQPAAIVLAGIGATLILVELRQRRCSEGLRLATVATCW